MNGSRVPGLLKDKSVGIPDKYKTTSLDARLGHIAGLTENDRTYTKYLDTCRFMRETQEDRKFVYDLKDVALSRGIAVTGVNGTGEHDRGISASEIVGGMSRVWACYLRKDLHSFQPHMLLPRKRATSIRTFYSHNTRPFQAGDVSSGYFQDIKVSGGQ